VKCPTLMSESGHWSRRPPILHDCDRCNRYMYDRLDRSLPLTSCWLERRMLRPATNDRSRDFGIFQLTTASSRWFWFARMQIPLPGLHATGNKREFVHSISISVSIIGGAPSHHRIPGHIDCPKYTYGICCSTHNGQEHSEDIPHRTQHFDMRNHI